ncbi:hypothetical protein RCL1_000294 [Eukaryota sp. TZLM3-RCL]
MSIRSPPPRSPTCSTLISSLTQFLQLQHPQKLSHITEAEVLTRLRCASKIHDFRVDELTTVHRFFNSRDPEEFPFRGRLRKQELIDIVQAYLTNSKIESFFTVPSTGFPTEFSECDHLFRATQHPLYKGVSNIFTRPFPSSKYPSMDLFTLKISEEQLNLLRSPHNPPFAIVLRLHLPQEVPPITHWESVHKLQVNGVKVDVSNCTKRIKGTITKDRITTLIPADITSYFIRYNSLQLTVEYETPAPDKGMIVCQLVRKLTINQAIDEVLSRPHLTEHSHKDFDDDELSSLKFTIPLTDPLTYSQILKPARGASCSHRDCFDLETFVNYSCKQCIWSCPVCTKPLPFIEVRYDKWFAEELLRRAPIGCEVAIVSQEKEGVVIEFERNDETGGDSSGDELLKVNKNEDFVKVGSSGLQSTGLQSLPRVNTSSLSVNRPQLNMHLNPFRNLPYSQPPARPTTSFFQPIRQNSSYGSEIIDVEQVITPLRRSPPGVVPLGPNRGVLYHSIRPLQPAAKKARYVDDYAEYRGEVITISSDSD